MKIRTILLLLIVWSTAVQFVHAEEQVKDLEPVIYEKLKFKKNTDYLHDEKKTEMKNTIPEKQFTIYFDGRKQLPNRNDTSFLFQTDKRGEISTVAVRSSELKLFSNEGKGKKELSTSPLDEGEIANNRIRTMILLAIIAVGLVVLFIVFIPKLVQTSDTSMKKVNEGRK
ncbi:type VII secretion protein EssA [Bacillus sp. FJAT-22090]|uniref:type VII secretion protein EssA n=1 Tax=Bacillus sp. FJAT-22090 TaxID=1581038 RepID=UPI0011A09381|nr:type VII secretion protein EssA [Bacillus sp. FJAT-22090]